MSICFAQCGLQHWLHQKAEGHAGCTVARHRGGDSCACTIQVAVYVPALGYMSGQFCMCIYIYICICILGQATGPSARWILSCCRMQQNIVQLQGWYLYIYIYTYIIALTLNYSLMQIIPAVKIGSAVASMLSSTIWKLERCYHRYTY